MNYLNFGFILLPVGEHCILNESVYISKSSVKIRTYEMLSECFFLKSNNNLIAFTCYYY